MHLPPPTAALLSRLGELHDRARSVLLCKSDELTWRRHARSRLIKFVAVRCLGEFKPQTHLLGDGQRLSHFFRFQQPFEIYDRFLQTFFQRRTWFPFGTSCAFEISARRCRGSSLGRGRWTSFDRGASEIDDGRGKIEHGKLAGCQD